MNISTSFTNLLAEHSSSAINFAVFSFSFYSRFRSSTFHLFEQMMQGEQRVAIPVKWIGDFLCVEEAETIMTGIGGREENGIRRADSNEEEYQVESVRDRISSSRGSRFNLIQKQFRLEPTRRRFSRENLINGIKCLVILPDSRYVRFSRTADFDNWFLVLLNAAIWPECDSPLHESPYTRNRHRRKTASSFNAN